MKTLILSVALIFSAMYVMAQNEIIQLYAAQKQWEKAKEEVDKSMANSKLKDKEKPAAYLWKLTVYSQLYADSSLSAKYPGANEEALDAFYKYQALDPSLKLMKEQNFQGGLGSIYNAYLTRGNVFWTAKQWDSSFKYFSQAERIGEMLIANKLTTNTANVDTVMVLFTAYSAQNSKQLDSAAKYYAKIADLKIAGKDYEDIYKFLIEYSSQKKNNEDFTKYLTLAKQLYPDNASAWTQYEMSNMTANANLPELLQKYQQEASSGTAMNEDKLIGYAEAFATTDKTQLDALDGMQKVSLKLAAAQAFSKASELNNANGLYAFNTGVIYYSLYGELDDRYSANRGEGAALKAKRAEIVKQQMGYADTAAMWLEKAYPILKAKQDRSKAETTSLNRIVDYLANIYYWKRDQTKTNSNSKDYDKYDALYKQYDAEHNAFK